MKMASHWLLSLKVALMSAGVLSTALMLKLSLPVLIDFLNCEIPYLWSIALTLLKPPYLYLLLNCIILTIVASSKLQPQKIEAEGFAVPIKLQEDVVFADPSPIKPVFGHIDADPVLSEYLDGVAEEKGEVEAVSVGETETEKEEFVVSRSNWMPRNPKEKPLVSQRFTNRKSVKANPEGGKVPLGVSKSKRQDTLESTWRTITEGRAMPLTRHLNKSETFNSQGRNDDASSTLPAPVMKKADTFSDRATSHELSPLPSGGSGRIRREPSLSQDELNRRVEAFIRKFNEEMRLQRQHSLNHYTNVVGRQIR